MPVTIALQPALDVRVVLATVAFAALATVTFGLWPAVRLSRTDTIRALNDQTGGMGGARRWFSTANLLVTAQMALSLALLILSALFVRAAALGAQANPGFALDRTVHAEVDPGLAGMDESKGREVRRHLLERLRSTPGVEAATAASVIPFGEVSITRRVQADGPRLRGNEPGAEREARRRSVLHRRSRLLPHARHRGDRRPRIHGCRRIALGRRRPRHHRRATRPAPVSRREPGRPPPPVRSLDDDGTASERPMEIVGLVAPTRHDMFEREPEPHLYLASGHAYVSTMHLHVRAAQGTSPASLVDMVRGEIRAAAPGLPVFSVATLEAHRDRSIPLWFLRTAARLFVILGAAAAFLAVVGLYGVKSYIVSRRTREFGVRQALGATPRDIVRQVLREGLPLTFGGPALGVGLGALLGKVLSVVLYQVSPFDPISFTLAAGVLSAASMVAAGMPARRAGRITPMEAMRENR